MTSKSVKIFPYEIKELTREENEEIRKLRKAIPLEFVRIGPKGYFLTKRYAEEAANIYNFPIKTDDTFVVSYPKSGTTWTQELVWLLGNNLDYEKAKSVMLNDRFPFLEVTMFDETEATNESTRKIRNEGINDLVNAMLPLSVDQVKELPSPRFIKSHLPMSLLPPNMLDTAKVVYIARDPRDVVVSFYHHHKLMKLIDPDAGFKQDLDLFIQNKILWTPYFEHVMEAWQKRNHPNMLFLFYEELSKDLSASIRRVAKFLGKEITDEQVGTLREHLKFDNFKKNTSVNMEHLKGVGIFNSNETFVRKGKVGGWQDYFDDEMTAKAEKWIADNIRDTDFRFTHF